MKLFNAHSLITYLFFVNSVTIFSQVKFEGLLAYNYIGDTLIVKPGDNTTKLIGYTGFYKKRYSADNERFLKPKRNDIIYPDLSGISSLYDSLVLKKFVCKNVHLVEKDIGLKYFYLEISNPTTGTIFFRYDTKNEWEFPFILDGDYINGEENFCKDLRYKKDIFDDSETWKSPSGFIDIIKRKIKGANTDSVTYCLLLKKVVKDPIIQKGGVVLLLKNGEKMIFDNASVNTSVNNGSMIVTATVFLNKNEINRIIESPISAYRIKDADFELRADYSDKNSEYLKCMINLR